MSPLRHYRIAVLLLSVALLGLCAGPDLAARPDPTNATDMSCGGLSSHLVAGLAGGLLVAIMWARRALRRLRYDWLAVTGSWGPPRRPRFASRRWP